MSIEAFLTTCGLVLTAIGLFFAGWQLRMARKIARGEFLLHLDELFQQHNEVHIRLRPAGSYRQKPEPEISLPEWAAIEAYMGLFERIKVLVDDRIIDLDTFDKLYGYRVDNIMDTDFIVKAKLKSEEAERWTKFEALVVQLREHREKKSADSQDWRM